MTRIIAYRQANRNDCAAKPAFAAGRASVRVMERYGRRARTASLMINEL
jgi:hypothetical protein